MSRKIKERTKQLANRELTIKKKLLGESQGLKSRVNRAGKTALIGGGIALIIYAMYKAFFQNDSKPKKSRVGRSTSGIVAEKVTTFLLPYLGKVLDDLIDKRKSNKVESSETEEESKL